MRSTNSIHSSIVRPRRLARFLRRSSLLLAVVTLVACERDAAPATAPATAAKLIVYTTFYPTEYFSARIANEGTIVRCPLPEDQDPATWKPDADTIAEYQTADLIVVNGASFEGWIETATLPESRLVDTTRAIAAELIVHERAVVHRHGPEGEHSHEGIDGHTWLDPKTAIEQAKAIRDALIARRPETRTEFETRFAALEKDLLALDAQLAAITEIGPVRVVASHPAYNYLVRRYGWIVRNLDLDPSDPIGEKQLAEIANAAREIESHVILWEGTPLEASVETLRRELGLESVVYSPGEGITASERRRGIDWLAIQKQNVASLSAALAKNSAAGSRR
jgi:zinc transport system substrate-binding protein